MSGSLSSCQRLSTSVNDCLRLFWWRLAVVKGQSHLKGLLFIPCIFSLSSAPQHLSQPQTLWCMTLQGMPGTWHADEPTEQMDTVWTQNCQRFRSNFAKSTLELAAYNASCGYTMGCEATSEWLRGFSDQWPASRSGCGYGRSLASMMATRKGWCIWTQHGRYHSTSSADGYCKQAKGICILARESRL